MVFNVDVFQCEEINKAACDSASRVSCCKGTSIAGGMTQNGVIQDEREKPGRKKIQEKTRSAIDIHLKNGMI